VAGLLQGGIRILLLTLSNASGGGKTDNYTLLLYCSEEGQLFCSIGAPLHSLSTF
jgi:hypothetical protein